MSLLDWIKLNRPGVITEYPDRIEIEHEKGDHSTLWLNRGSRVPAELEPLGLYHDYDGMDLFSSTFKIAALAESKGKNGVEIVFNLNQLGAELSSHGAKLPEPSIAFMYQQGIGFYSISKSDSNRIFEWDSEMEDLSDEFVSFLDILNEWKEAVDG